MVKNHANRPLQYWAIRAIKQKSLHKGLVDVQHVEAVANPRVKSGGQVQTGVTW
jgi:hypothetical protein